MLSVKGMKHAESLVRYLLDLFSDPEGGKRSFVHNIGKLPGIAPQPRGQYFSTHIYIYIYMGKGL
jgi:hypothetical protein